MRKRYSIGAMQLLIGLLSWIWFLHWTNDLLAQATDRELLTFTQTRSDKNRVTQFPVWMDFAAQAACRPQRPDQNRQKSPHVDRAIHVYCDQANLSAMWDPYAKFEVGSIILKEKMDPLEQSKIELFTGMLKREKDFNPLVGDWEFFTVSGDAKQITSRGKLESCMECHRNYPDSDFVTKSYAALANKNRRFGVWVDNQWNYQVEPVCNGAAESIFLPASLASTHGKKLSRREAGSLYLSQAAESRNTNSNSNLSAISDSPPIPEDLSSLGGPKLRYEPQHNKNTLGYWTEVDDSASWKIAFEKPGTYQVSVLQGCGTGNGGSQVSVSLADQQLEFTVVDTGGFQNFRWLEVGELKVAAASELELVVKPKNKTAAAVMDIRQIRLSRIDKLRNGNE